MNRILERQLKKFFTDSGKKVPKELKPVFESISKTYDDFDKYKVLMDRSLKINSEELISESEERYRSLFNTANLLIQSVGPDKRFKLVNKEWQKILGYSQKEAISMKFYEVIKRSEFSHCIKAFKSLEKGKDIYGVETIFVTKNSKEIYVRGNIHPVMNDGKFVSTIGFFMDITDQKKAQEALYASEERMRLFITHAPAALAMFDKNMCYLAASHRWVSDYHLRNKNIIGQSHYEIFPEIPDKLKKIHRRGMKGETIKSDEDRFMRADGSIQYIRWEMLPWYDASGSIGGIVIFSEDVTKQKDIENALKSSEEKYRAVFENTGNATCIIESDNTISLVNSRFVDLTGYSKSEIEGKKKWINFITPEYLDLMKKYHKARISGDTEKPPSKYEFDMIDRKSNIKHILLTIDLIPGTDKSIASLVDITEKKRIEEELRKNQTQLSNAMKMAHMGPWEYDVLNDKCIFNDIFYALFHTTAAKVGGYTMSSHDYVKRFVHPDDIQIVKKEINKSVQSKDLNLIQRSIDHRIIYQDGKIGYVSVSIFIVRNEKGQVIKTYGIHQDITERKMADNEIKNKIEQMEFIGRINLKRHKEVMKMKRELENIKSLYNLSEHKKSKIKKES